MKPSNRIDLKKKMIGPANERKPYEA